MRLIDPKRAFISFFGDSITEINPLSPRYLFMARVAFVNMGCYEYWHGKRTFPEPINLLPMHNICLDAKHESRIFQFGMSNQNTLKDILAFRPDVVSFSYFGKTEEMVANTHKLLKAFGRQTPITFMGGTDIYDRSNYYAEQFGRYDFSNR